VGGLRGLLPKLKFHQFDGVVLLLLTPEQAAHRAAIADAFLSCGCGGRKGGALRTVLAREVGAACGDYSVYPTVVRPASPLQRPAVQKIGKGRSSIEQPFVTSSRLLPPSPSTYWDRFRAACGSPARGSPGRDRRVLYRRAEGSGATVPQVAAGVPSTVCRGAWTRVTLVRFRRSALSIMFTDLSILAGWQVVSLGGVIHITR
jgi:hypothetical protein